MSMVCDQHARCMARIRKLLRSYKDAGYRAKYAAKLLQDVHSLAAPHLHHASNGQASTLQQEQHKHQGAGGVQKQDAGGMGNSFTPKGNNLQSNSAEGNQPSTFTPKGDNSQSIVTDEVDALEQQSSTVTGTVVVEPEWPTEATLIIEGACPNPRLLDCRLVDSEGRKGKRCSLWKGWGNQKVGMTVRAVLDRGGRDAVYRQA